MNNPKGKQAALKGQLTILQGQLDNHVVAPLTPARVRHIKSKIDEYSVRIDVLNEEIFSSTTDVDAQDSQQAEYAIMTTKLLELIDGIAEMEIPGSGSTTVVGGDVGVRLPKIELPTFSGDLQDWNSFYDLFVATIHRNIKLSKAQKLQYLKSSLKGEPSNLIRALHITDANYDEAWDLLSDRYNNRREIVQAHLKRLFNQQIIKEESATALRKLLDTTNECTRALRVLGRSVDSWDDVLVFLVTERMDLESRRQWVLSLEDDEPPNYKELVKFLDQRARALAEAGCGSRSKSSIVTRPPIEGKSTMATYHISSPQSSREQKYDVCIGCNGQHTMSKCPEFLKLSVIDRNALARKNKLCFNCLRSEHGVSNCSSSNCKTCNSRHHTLLHPLDNARPAEESRNDVQISCNTTSTDEVENSQVLLATALVDVCDIHGVPVTVRVLIDNCSQASFVTENCINKLGLTRQSTRMSISGLSGSSVGVPKAKTTLHLKSRIDNRVSLDVQALILPKVTNPLPSTRCKPEQWTHLTNLTLADPLYYEKSNIDMLLGADIYADIIQPGICRGEKGSPLAQATTLGWIVVGAVHPSQSRNIAVHHVQSNLDTVLRRFWELEELPTSNHRTPEEKLCGSHFASYHSRDYTGRFSVRLPFRENAPPLGSSRTMAVHRLMQVERRFKNNSSLEQQYRSFMKEYLDLGHMKPIPNGKVDKATGPVYYLPHHAVLKESINASKFRVVFDASAKTSNGTSLNETLMVGPKLQDDLVPILLRFRFHLVAICADISKMYRQILVHPDDWDYQRIVWRENLNQPVRDYWLITVTYGTASAPYQATKCTKQLAIDERESFPRASKFWQRDAYVDDLMSGASSQDEALVIQTELIQMLQTGGFDLRKWSSNNTAVLEAVPSNIRETQLPLSLDTDQSVKTLGLHWHPASDIFSFSVHISKLPSQYTKRYVLSDIAKVFDPLGWLSPTTIYGKILIQQLWKAGLSWDDCLPEAAQTSWTIYRNELHHIQLIQLPRCIVAAEISHIALHGFCDASESAYAAVVYIRCTTPSNKISIHLIAAKTKVAPLKKVSLPRLELCGSLLLARLINLIRQAIVITIDEVVAWTDSTIVLDWLASPPDRWKTFVANRVSEIQEELPSKLWRHVKSEENPADCASRGIMPSDLVNHPLWWQGPAWLTELQIPESNARTNVTDGPVLEEKKTEIKALINTKIDMSLLQKYSSLGKLLRITSYVRRYIHNLHPKVKISERRVGFLSVAELDSALKFWIKQAQTTDFHDEHNCITKGKNLPTKSRISSLNPFLGDDGLLRVGGRLQHAKVSMDKKHPILLPKNHIITKMIIAQEHLRLLHAGAQLLLGSLQRRFWIPNGRDAVRHHIRKCLVCIRHRGESVKQIMGSLPQARVTIDRPFLNTGIDYAGPFHLRVLKGRGRKQFKAYVALFICLTTKAMHLEAVSDLTTGAFIAALQRFVSRRGKCRDLFSDCGTNFVGANRELKEWIKQTKSEYHNETMSKYLTTEGINWHFNPPSAPHQGGLWEAGVKSVKFHLKRVVGNATLNYEEFTTLLYQIEACLNSRPLCPLSNDPEDLIALTPGHFIIGDALTAIPEPSLTQLKISHLSRWQLVQQLVQHFWRRWTSEYLSRLQQRPKWWSHQPNLQVGNLVLVKDERLSPLSWPLGRIIRVHPGADGHVRVVTVRTAKSEFIRPIVKICHLPIESQT